MKKVTFLLTVFLIQFAHSQSTTILQTVYGGSDSDKMSGATVVSDGTVLSGYYKSIDGDFTANYGNYDCFVLKTDVNGALSWKTTFGGTQADYLYDITTDASGNIIAVGTSKSNDNDITGNHGNYDYLVVKLDANGVILWQKSFGGTNIDKATSVIATSDGGYLVLGYSKSTDGDITAGTSHGGYDLWLLKLDSAGTILWQKIYGGANDDRAGHLYYNGTNYYVAAYSKSNNGDLTVNHGNYDYWIFSIDNTGTILWQRSYGGSGIEKEPVLDFNASNIVVAGYSNSTDGDITNPLGNFDFWVLSIADPNGIINWQKNLGGTDADFATGIGFLPVLTRSTLSGSELYVVGYTNSDDGDFSSNGGNYDAWYLGIDFSGNVINSTNFGGSNLDIISGAVYGDDFKLRMYGTTKSNDGSIVGQHGNYDAWYIEMTPELSGSINDNNLINVKVFPNPTTDFLHIESENIQQVIIFDMQGKQVFKQSNLQAIDTYSINMSSLSAGNYFIKVLTSDGLGISKFQVE